MGALPVLTGAPIFWAYKPNALSGRQHHRRAEIVFDGRRLAVVQPDRLDQRDRAIDGGKGARPPIGGRLAPAIPLACSMAVPLACSMAVSNSPALRSARRKIGPAPATRPRLGGQTVWREIRCA